MFRGSSGGFLPAPLDYPNQLRPRPWLRRGAPRFPLSRDLGSGAGPSLSGFGATFSQLPVFMDHCVALQMLSLSWGRAPGQVWRVAEGRRDLIPACHQTHTESGPRTVSGMARCRASDGGSPYRHCYQTHELRTRR
jgi:hypothetical protein